MPSHPPYATLPQNRSAGGAGRAAAQRLLDQGLASRKEWVYSDISHKR